MNQFNTHTYKNALTAKKLGQTILYFKTIDSTNDYAFKLKENNIVDGTLILAEQQTKGRGQFDVQWISPRGGLWFTLIIEFEMDMRQMPKITILCAYAVAQTLAKLYQIKVNIKWPNDLYYHHKKLGGILAESCAKGGKNYLHLGIGLNVNFGSKELGPCSSMSATLQEVLGKPVNREKLLAELVCMLENIFLKFLSDQDFAYFFRKIEKILIY